MIRPEYGLWNQPVSDSQTYEVRIRDGVPAGQDSYSV